MLWLVAIFPVFSNRLLGTALVLGRHRRHTLLQPQQRQHYANLGSARMLPDTPVLIDCRAHVQALAAAGVPCSTGARHPAPAGL